MAIPTQVPHLLPLAYQADSLAWFARVRHLPHAVWLDSAASPYGRFDIISAAPSTLLQTEGQYTRIQHPDGRCETREEDPFSLLQQLLPTGENTPHATLPFIGGALGYFGYDLGRRLEKLPAMAKADIPLPDMYVGIYPWAIDLPKPRAAAVCGALLA